jgi:hypothetical protein
MPHIHLAIGEYQQEEFLEHSEGDEPRFCVNHDSTQYETK